MFRKELTEKGEEEKRLSGFKLVPSIFGVSETKGEDLPEYEPPEWSKERAMGKLSIIQVSYESLEGNSQGYSIARRFAINPVAVYPFKTTLHEFSHIVAGHTVPEQTDEYRTHRGLCEFEAEGSAYLLLNELGATVQFDTAESRSYIQHWLDGDEPPESSVKRVFSTADKIYRAGLEEPEGDEPDVERNLDSSGQLQAA